MTRLLEVGTRAETIREREGLLKLALRAQAQCVTTTEALANLAARQENAATTLPAPVLEPIIYGKVYPFPAAR